MKIGVNSRIYQEENAGVQNYIKNLYKDILEINTRDDYLFFQTNDNKKLGQTDYFKLPQNSLFAMLFDNFLVSWLDFKHKPDLFHACANVLPIIRRKKCKYVVTIYDLAPIISRRYSPSYLFRQYFKWSTKRSAKSADLIITISKNTKKDLIKYFSIDPKKIKVIYPGVSQKYFLENDSNVVKKKSSKKYFFSVTTNPRRKNIISVLKIISKNKSFFKDYKYRIAGLIQEEELENINKIMQKYKLEEVVELLGYVSDRELKKLYRRAEFFIYPSLYEGFGLPLVEAMASRCLAIGANNSSMVEIMPDERFLVDPYDLNDIFFKMKRVILMPRAEKQKIINLNFNYVKRFDWQMAAKKFIKSLRRLNKNYEAE